MRLRPSAIRWRFSGVLALSLGMLYPTSTSGQAEKYLYPPEWVIGQKWVYTVVREGLSDCLSCEMPMVRHNFEVVVTGKKSGSVFDTLAFRAKVDSLPRNSTVPAWSKTGTGTSLFHREQREFRVGEIPVFMTFNHLPKHYSFLDSAHFATRQNGNYSSSNSTHVDTLSTSTGLRKAIATKGSSNYAGYSEGRILYIEGWGIVYDYESSFNFPGGYKSTWVLRELVLPNQSPIVMDSENWYAQVSARPVALFHRERSNQVWPGGATVIKPRRNFKSDGFRKVDPLGRITSEYLNW
jgi:hypothetical protein